MNGNATESLRQQFQRLQQHHQKKLLLRKQRLSDTATGQNAEVYGSREDHNTASSASGWLGAEIGDNLELKLEDDSNADTSIHQSSELDNVARELKDENGRLYKLLAERDEEMRILRKQSSQERQALIGSGLASDTAANRIMDLSKKNRELAADIEKERRKVRQLTKKLSELQSQNSSSAPQDSNTKDAKDQKVSHKDFNHEEQVSSHVLQEKLKQALTKVAEYRNQCEILKKEARLAQKVIAKECGEGVTVTSILNEPSGWRGRQQQITTLQNKINELREQLSGTTTSKLVQSSNVFDSPSFDLQRVTTPSFHDEKHKHMLRKMEKNKKEAYEKASRELQILTEEHSKLQTKFDAARTRNKILASELKGLKTQTKMLIEKGTHDDELIAALMREQERLQKTLEKKNSQIANRCHSRTEARQQDSELVLTLTQLCKEREEKVAELERELKTMVSDVPLESSQIHSNFTNFEDKATITDNINAGYSDIFNPSGDYQQNRQTNICNSRTHNYSTDSSPRRRRIVRTSGRNSAGLPPTPPRSGSGRRTTSSLPRYGLVPVLSEPEITVTNFPDKMSGQNEICSDIPKFVKKYAQE